MRQPDWLLIKGTPQKAGNFRLTTFVSDRLRQKTRKNRENLQAIDRSGIVVLLFAAKRAFAYTVTNSGNFHLHTVCKEDKIHFKSVSESMRLINVHVVGID